MNLQPSSEITTFIDTPDQKTLEILYFLNQENTPEVGSLPSVEALRSLIQLSAINFYVLSDKNIIGFAICFRENSEYQSLNYKFFSDSEEKFLYIDRVVIKEGFRREGAGTKLYNNLSMFAKKESMPLCCEVNTFPKNQISLNFHAKNGFSRVGSQNFDDHSVDYLKK